MTNDEFDELSRGDTGRAVMAARDVLVLGTYKTVAAKKHGIGVTAIDGALMRLKLRATQQELQRVQEQLRALEATVGMAN